MYQYARRHVFAICYTIIRFFPRAPGRRVLLKERAEIRSYIYIYIYIYMYYHLLHLHIYASLTFARLTWRCLTVMWLPLYSLLSYEPGFQAILSIIQYYYKLCLVKKDLYHQTFLPQLKHVFSLRQQQLRFLEGFCPCQVQTNSWSKLKFHEVLCP